VKVRQNRLRRMAERQGLGLRKSHRRDPRAIDYGIWSIVDPDTNTAFLEGEFLTLDELEEWLLEIRQPNSLIWCRRNWRVGEELAACATK
jgi:hypothetical protein